MAIVIEVYLTGRDSTNILSLTRLGATIHARIILSSAYQEQIAYFKYFLSHADYDKEDWKNDPYFR